MLFTSMRRLSKGKRLISKATFSRLAICGFLAQAALLKLTCSADTAILGKMLRLTGPAIINSRPVVSRTSKISICVSLAGLIRVLR